MSDTSFDEARLAVAEAQLLAYDVMFDAFVANAGLQEYDFDSGQTRQKVTRADLSQMRLAYQYLENRVVTLRARCTGCGVTSVRPGW